MADSRIFLGGEFTDAELEELRADERADERAAILEMVRGRINAVMEDCTNRAHCGDARGEAIASAKLSLLDGLAADIEARGEG